MVENTDGSLSSYLARLDSPTLMRAIMLIFDKKTVRAKRVVSMYVDESLRVN